MYLETFNVTSTEPIQAVPLTPEAFLPYGGVLSADHQIKGGLSSANYGTAVKLHKVAPIVNNYQQCPSGEPATANWNIFRCSAPKHLIKGKRFKMYKAKVLERHPFTTQTFLPMGLPLERYSYLVIVAKTNEKLPNRLPDVSQLKAFVCKGNQSITYAPGIWHAPMVVIDESVPHIDFGVMIHENGVLNEDTQEISLEPHINVEYVNPSAPNL